MDEDIVGYDEDIIGAVQARGLPVTAASSVPFTLAASTTTVVTITPTMPFRPDSLRINRTAASSVLINSISIGPVNILASDGSIDGDCFAPDSVAAALRSYKTATSSLPIKISVTNKTATAITNFVITAFGPCKGL